MYERIPISGIRESYCPRRETRTVVMPLLIATLLGGMVWFYFEGAPHREDSATAEALPASAPEIVSAEASDGVPVSEEAPPAAPAASALPLITRGDLGEKDFTPWMSSLALETYIRQKNRGHRDSFWSRGNWIRGIECRWHEGAREVRIALGTMSRPGQIDWQYRLDMTGITYAEEIGRWKEKGYSLVQSQAYRHPDGSRRYQAVWQLVKEAEVAGR